jgi:Flp pilus assembly protein protease CpaA
MARKSAAARRRARNLRIVAWIVLIAIVAFAVVRFLQLSRWAQVGVVAALVLLALCWFLISRRQQISEEMDRLRDDD